MQLKTLCKKRKLLNPQTLRIMKITAFMICAFFIHVSAATLAQTVTLSEHKASLEKVINEIKQQTGYSFFYNQDWLQQAKPVDLVVKDESLDAVLKACFADQPFDFAIVNKTIVLKLKKVPTINPNGNAVPITVTGKVFDGTGQPMPNVNVREKGTQNGTTTDGKGTYSLTVTDNNSIVTFTFIGYEPQELQAKNIPNGSTITLKPAENNLKEVVISKGYYNEKRLLSTSDVSVVDSKTISEQPVSDPIQALIGRVPGLDIQQTSGLPGAYATIHIRGLNSIANGNDPYYIVDGVPVSSVSLSSPYAQSALGYGGGIQNGGGGLSPFNILNPDDIENIEVLKDADATSIYGTKGANGVIIITTKKGKAGETKVNFDLSQGIGQVSHFMDLLNTSQYLQMMHRAYANDGVPFPTLSDAAQGDPNFDINGVWDTTRYTNWQKVLIGNTAHYTNAQGSISGGNANTQFLISGGYSRSTTVFPDNYDGDKKASLNFSLTHTSANQKFHVLFSGGYGYETNDVPYADLTSQITLPPDAPSLFHPDGTLNWQNYNGSYTFFNPLSYVNTNYYSSANNLISNLTLSYQLLPGLMLQSSFGYNHVENNQVQLKPATTTEPPPYNPPSRDGSNYSNGISQGWIIEPQLSYQKKIGKGQLNVLLGGTVQQTSYSSLAQYSNDFANDALITDPLAGSQQGFLGYSNSLTRYVALVARVGYSWDDKYILNLTANRDGSSNFGPGKQYGNFGSVGTGWIFSKEKAVTDAAPWLSLGKLRASYGTTGDGELTPYQYLSTYSPNSLAYQRTTILVPNGLTNPYFAWEVDKKLEGGLDLGFLKDRISLSIDYYRNRTSNQLTGYTLPQITGFSSVVENLPATIQNTGLEVELHTINFQTTDFNWSTSVTFTLPNNKLVSFYNFATSGYQYSYTLGHSLYTQKLYQYTGVNPQTGVYNFVSTSGDPVNPNFPQDMVPSQPITQKYYGGLQNSFSYKGISLDVFIQFVKQLGYSYQEYFNVPGLDGAANFGGSNEPTAILGAWQTSGQIASTQRYYGTDGNTATAYQNFRSSTGVISDASFIKIKNVALSYKLPVAWQQWAHMQNAKIYLNGQNLYTFTKYIGLDPETPGLGLPPLRVIMLGISASF